MRTPGAKTKGKKPKRKVIIVSGATDFTGPLVTPSALQETARTAFKKKRKKTRMVARA